MANTCGVGGWNGPVAGDPDNSSVLSAVSKFGGIEISWTTPSTNGFAVSFTRMYRSTNDNYALAVPFMDVGGNYFFDSEAADVIRPYYYWIQHHSINGTVLDAIGPAMATAKPLLEKVLEDLSQKISSSELSESLRNRIDSIDGLAHGLTQLSTLVETENGAIAQELLAVRDTVTQSVAYINQRAIVEAGAREAFVQQVNQQLSQTVDNSALFAALEEESTTRANETGELFAQKTIKLDVAGHVSGLGFSARVDPDGSDSSNFQIASDSFELVPPVQVSNTAPTNPFQGKIWRDTSVTPNVTRWYNQTTQAWQTTPVNGLIPFTVRTTPVTVDGVSLEPGVYIQGAYIDRISANQIDSRNLIIRDADGVPIFGAGNPLQISHIAGLGAMATVDEITTENASTYIKSGVITNAMIGNVIQSTNFNLDNGTGWKLDKNGDLHLFNLFARGDIQATSLNAATGTFSGTMTADAVNAVKTINIAGDAVIVPRRGAFANNSTSSHGQRLAFSLGSIDFTYGGKAVFFIRAYVRPFPTTSGRGGFFLQASNGDVIWDTGSLGTDPGSQGDSPTPYVGHEFGMFSLEYLPPAGVSGFTVYNRSTDNLTAAYEFIEVTVFGCKR